MTTLLRHCPLISILLVSVYPTFAQWITQTIVLQPGWNAVFLEVQPDPKECDGHFASLPIESVWAWNEQHSPVQFIQDPDQLLPGQPDWLSYFPPSHPARAGMNLFILQANHTYLIKLPNNAAPINWTVHGQPVVRRMDWLPDSYNFVGFHVDSANSPTFQSFFAGSPAHAGQPVYRMVNGLWQRVTTPASTRLNRGGAYWVFCRGGSSFAGPVEAAVGQGKGLDYGRILTEQTLTIRNRSLTTRTFTLRQLPSTSPSGSVEAGVPLYYFRMTLAVNDAGWYPLPTPLAKSLAPGQEWNLRLEARRAEMAPFTGSPGLAAPAYQSLLEISDEAGSRSLLGVRALGLQASAAAAGVGGGGAGTATALPHPRAGLWMGSASVANVSQPASFDPTTPMPTASPFQLRVLIHVDNAGQARLLQKVLQMWKNGTTRPDPDNPAVQITDQPGRYVLVTDDALIPNFSGATLRDGRAVARRISTAAFGFRDPLPMTGAGDFGSPGSQFTCAVSLSYGDPLNPFVHRYHPDHNNLDDQNPPQPLLVRTNATGQLYTAESSGVDRVVQFEFTAADPDDLRLPGWQDDLLGGIYRETIKGLHKSPLHIQGTFRVQQASRVGILNDGL